MRSFSIIVPVYKDNALVKAKIANILSLQYPAKLVEVFIAHGGAKSNYIKTLTKTDPLIRIMNLEQAGKIYQINEAIGECYGDIIIISDVDALMQPNCLQEIDKAFKDQDTAIVGVWTTPKNCTQTDTLYWYVANWLRILEGKIWSVSHVTGCCMAFRKDLLGKRPFADDVIADDVYLPMIANFMGKKVRYIRTTEVFEIRQPKTFGEFLRHKLRKGNAVLRELLRCCYLLPEAPIRMKLIWLARLFQFTILTPAVFLSYPFFKQNSIYRKVK